MIDAKQNRLDYGKQLAPPIGFELDHAVGTTYSLDLEAILLIPVALFFSEDLDINPKEIRDDTLESLVNVSKKVSIYHQRGKIKVPEQYSQLMAYWERGLCPVHLDSYFRSFHPKIWIIRYTEIKGKKVIYRVINTSRNLTFSRDWDLAVTTEGQVETNIQDQNEPLIDMLKFLNGFKKIPKEYFKELAHVKFDVLNGFDDLLFHPIGIKDKKGEIYKNPITSDKYMKDFKLIMSPFMDDSTIKSIAETSRETAIFSSADELSKLSPEFLEGVNSKYMFSPFIEDAENAMEISESGVIPMYQNLHAKYYITQRGGKRSWFIGSANATSPANERNIELLIELRGGKYKYRPQVIEEELTSLNSDGISLFEKFHGNTTKQIEEDRIWQQHLRRLIYEISSIRFSADVLINKNETFDLSIAIPKATIEIPDDVEIKIKPLPEQSLASEVISFSEKTIVSKYIGYQEVELSPFLVIELWRNNELEKKFIVDMVIDLDRFANRMNKIFSNIISNRSKFLSYLSFLLSDSSPTVIDSQSDDKKPFGSTSSHNGIAFFEGTPIYEKLLVAASRDPKKLKKINSLIERIKDQNGKDDQPIISSQFEEMWEIFKPFSK